VFRPEDYGTLETLFYGNEDLSRGKVLQWLRYTTGRQDISPHEVHTVIGLYGLWREGLLRVIGNDVLLRKVESN